MPNCTMSNIFFIGGQIDEKYGEFNTQETVRKELKTATYWFEKLPFLKVFVDEYELCKISADKSDNIVKRKLLCRSTFHFFLDEDEALLQKCALTIEDANKQLCFRKVYSQIDRINRKFHIRK